MRNRLPMIFSTTALLVAVLGVTPFGEAAYNAVVPKNSVGTKQLQRNAVKAAKIAPNAVRTGHVLNGSLLVEDFKAGQIPQGPKGDKGEKGDKGDKGDPGATNVTQRYVDGAVTNGSNASLTANCNAGERATGGGSELLGGTISNFHFFGDNPVPHTSGTTPTGWSDSVFNNSGSGATWRVYVICASP